MSLSEHLSRVIIDNGLDIEADDYYIKKKWVKEFIKDLKFQGEIDFGKDTLTIKYSKFKELAGKNLI